jgi:hypothetical protein
LVAREPEDVLDSVRLAPSHELVAGKPRIRAQEDPHPRPAGPDPGHDACDLVDRASRGVDVRAAELGGEQDDLFGRHPVRLEEKVDEQAFERGAVVADLMVAARRQRRVLEPVQRALAGERGAVSTSGFELARQGREHRVVPELVVVDQVLVPERDADHALRHHRLDRVFDLRLGAVVKETCREPGR